MKCEELKAHKADVTIPVYGTIADAQVYLKDKVDAAIAELKAKLDEKDKDIAYWRKEYDEETKLTDALNACGGNKTLACQSLGVSRATLYRALKEADK